MGAEADSDVQGHEYRMDSAKWRMYGSVMVALGMSGDGGGVRVGGGLQCWWINVLG